MKCRSLRAGHSKYFCQSGSSAEVGNPGNTYGNAHSVCLLLSSGFVQPRYIIVTLECPRALVRIKAPQAAF